MRRAARDQLRLVGAVDADDAAARPVADPSVGGGAQRVAAVDRLVGEAQLLAHPEVTRRCRRGRLADAHAGLEDRPATAAERERGGLAVHDDRGGGGTDRAERGAPDPARPAVGTAGDADLHPVVSACEDEVDLGPPVLGQQVRRRDVLRGCLGLGADRDDLHRMRPLARARRGGEREQSNGGRDERAEHGQPVKCGEIAAVEQREKRSVRVLAFVPFVNVTRAWCAR